MPEPMIRRGDAEPALVVDGLVRERVDTVERDGPLAALLDAAGPDATADHATVYSGDGHFFASIPLDALRRSRLVDGRLRVPDPPTKCWDVKDVVRVELTAGRQPDTVPDYG